MRLINADELRTALPYERLVRALPERLLAGAMTPQRPVFDLGHAASLLLMPAWSSNLGGVKIVHVTPENAMRRLPCVAASYLIFDGETHRHLALIDGEELTARRTAAVAAVAMNRLAKPDAARLLLIGSGRIASEIPFAFRAVRNLKSVSVFSPTRDNAETLVLRLIDAGFDAIVCEDIAQQIRYSDLIACATLSQTPWIEGRYLSDQHISLIGGFTPDMREADKDTLRRARVYIDTEAALGTAGDLEGLSGDQVAGQLRDLCDPMFKVDEGLSVFKSVGEAAQDLATAQVLFDSLNG
ncbi:ornithine cyclodeaminase/mu-crystallin [Asticcacaulis excentricus]|uniref:Ornithine cyclodeaminase/mu-crystallin n=1 Tax=Asticcacaulis excentricus (strain ATCC 15261 / DSM 4724 / KCTC 12464 / NCIMB 9791 / VKM B-1370 / CB 48) TaxID=573065 RepID=E8RLH0_ASTEC|nr:ornithine cyclodeaminase/mu-crystallin [Asticcacaulis excentricus]ADU13714.1 ornithine cyclodeaminase/mu-crystallin [Asticcacaulis excentricus CB 48]